MNFNINFPAGYSVHDPLNDNIDINVIVGEDVYFGTLFTLKNINDIIEKGQPESKYFLATNMLIVKDLSKETILLAVQEVISDNYLNDVFDRIGDIDSIYGVPPNFGELI